MLSTATKVLVVDERREIRAWIADVLLEHAYDVRTAQCGLEALDTMAVWTPDVVVTDIRMARMSGLELMLRIRQAQRAVGIVAMSEMETARDAAVATQLGADRFLLKPFGRAELLTAIESARDVPDRARPRRLAVPPKRRRPATVRSPQPPHRHAPMVADLAAVRPRHGCGDREVVEERRCVALRPQPDHPRVAERLVGRADDRLVVDEALDRVALHEHVQHVPFLRVDVEVRGLDVDACAVDERVDAEVFSTGFQRAT